VEELDKERSIDSTDFDFSRTATLSPGFKWYEGMFTLHHLR
jgi:hypothetical protein